MAEFARLNERFQCRGIQLTKPPDMLDAGKFPRLDNVMVYQDGRIDPRPGLNTLATVPAFPTSLRRLNDLASGDYTLITGASGSVYFGKTGVLAKVADMLGSTVIADGYGQLQMVPFRPESSPQAWMYSASNLKMCKVRVDGKAAKIGVAPPANEPTGIAGRMAIQYIEDCVTDPPAWVASGVAGAITAVATIGPLTIGAIVYDTGTTGWASINLVTTVPPTGIGTGQRLEFDTGGANEEVVLVHDTLRAPVASTAVSAIQDIIYDSTANGSGTGLACVVPSVPISDMVSRSLIVFDQGGVNEETCQILSTVQSKDGVTAFRVRTTANHSPGETIEGLSCIRAYTANTQVATTVAIPRYYFSSASGAGDAIMTLDAAKDITWSDTPDRRQIQLEDYLHITIFFTGLAALQEGKLMFDVDAANNDFSRNYYYYAFKPNDLRPAADSSLTVTETLSQAQQASQINDTELPSYVPGQMAGAFNNTSSPQPFAGQMIAGDFQWTELRLKVSDLVRVGSDNTRGLSDIQAVRLQFSVTDIVNIIAFGSFWVGGTYGPDSGDFALPYYYAYRSRQPATGAASLLSPPTRVPTPLNRQKATVVMEHQPDPQVDSTVGGVLDVFRFGGTLSKFQYVGSTPNTAGNPTFEDTFTDANAGASDPADETRFQPFPIIDTPKTGRCDVVGSTVVRVSGDFFNLNWAPGTQIFIAGIPYTLYAQPKLVNLVIAPPFGNFLEITENGGDLANVEWQVNTPVVMGQPLPVLFGPYPQTQNLFALGDTANPGRLYWTNGNDADSADDANWVDVTTPSEPLMNGGLYRDTAAVVFSMQRIFRVYPGQTAAQQFVAEPVVNTRGLYARYGVAFGPLIYFISKDGIYVSDGSPAEPQSITDEDLYPLFPHEGYVPPVSINGIFSPDYSRPDDMRLEYAQNILRFIYVNQGGDYCEMYYNTQMKAWFPASRAMGAPIPAVFYSEEEFGALIPDNPRLLVASSDGHLNGIISEVTGAVDEGVDGGGLPVNYDINCKILTRSQNAGDFRASKLWGDFNVDLEGNGETVTAQVFYNNNQLSLPAQNIVAPVGRGLREATITSGDGLDALTMALLFSWVATADGPRFYGLESFASPYPLDLLALKTIPGTHGYPQYQHVREFFPAIISTTDLTFVVTIDGVAYSYTIPSTGGVFLKPRVSLRAVKGKVFSYKIYGDSQFKLFVGDSELHVGVWAREGPYDVVRSFGPQGP